GRYQTAAEVAELLSQHLAHVQHPSLVPLRVTKPAESPATRRSRLVTVVALLCLAGVIGLGLALLRVFNPVEDGPEGKAPPTTKARETKLTPAEGFTPLFDGKSLTGWAAASGGTGMWKIEGGALTCAGPSDYLLTVRNDFGDFHLRAEVKINANGNSGIYF